MPCYDGRDRCDPDERNVYQLKIDRLTDLLCQAGRSYLNNEEVPRSVLHWWEQHRKIDEQRGKPWTKKG